MRGEYHSGSSGQSRVSSHPRFLFRPQPKKQWDRNAGERASVESAHRSLRANVPLPEIRLIRTEGMKEVFMSKLFANHENALDHANQSQHLDCPHDRLPVRNKKSDGQIAAQSYHQISQALNDRL